jgi:hypothetical protein
LEELGVDEMIILKWIFGKWTGLIWLRIGTLNAVMNLRVS